MSWDSSDRSYESALLARLADAVAERVCRNAIRLLQRMPGNLDGNEYGFNSAWECVCAQMQDETWVSWDAWEASINGIIEGLVEELPRPELEALWLQTDPGYDWRWEVPGQHAECPANPEQVVRYLREEVLYEKARQWTNRRIRVYLERDGMRD